VVHDQVILIDLPEDIPPPWIQYRHGSTPDWPAGR
jgi:hypothetical protein